SVFPRFLALLREMEVTAPAFTLYVIHHARLLASMMWVGVAAIYIAGLVYIAGPRLTARLQSGLFPIRDWLVYQMPWRRKRMQRDFAAMLAILLDAEVPEERAVALAAAATANTIFGRNAAAALAALRGGQKLPQALCRLDDTGEFCLRLTNASHSSAGFRAALDGWIEAMDAKAFQQQQAAAQIITTTFVLVNGALVGTLVVGTFQTLIA